MRRAWGYVLFTVGIFLFLLSPAMLWYTTPRVAKAPYDVFERSVLAGSGRYFSPKLFAVTPTRQFTAIQLAKGNPAASTKRVAVIGLFTRTVDVTAHEDADYSFDVYAMDRSTGYAVHCCGEKPRHEGVTLKFPFNVDKNTIYPFYDSTAHKAFPAKYLRTETLEGMKTYVFRTEVPPTFLTKMELPASLAGGDPITNETFDRYYKGVTTLWVEPTSGAVMKASNQQQQWLQDSSGAFVTVLADTNLTSTPETVKRVAKELSTGIRSITLLKLTATWIPLYAPILGAIATAAGLWLLLRTPALRRPDASRFFVETPTSV